MMKRAFQLQPGDIIPGMGMIKTVEHIGPIVIVRVEEDYPLETSFRRNALVCIESSSQPQDLSHG